MRDVRLIDANALLRKLQEQQKYSSVNDSRGIAKAILEVIHAPTIGAQPVKHGKWIPNTSLPGQTGFHCSECMFTDKGTYSRRFKRYKRCPNCCADMRGDADGNQI